MKRCDRDSEDYLLLKHYSWLLFKNSSKIDRSKYILLKRYFYCFDGRYVHPDLIINKLLSLSNDLSIAYSIKEEYAYWNKFATSENACKNVQGIIDQLLIAYIPKLTKVAITLKHWNREIIDSFDRFQGRRISNGPVESVNSRIKIIKQNGNGYANFDRFRARVLYSLNKNSSIKL
ncbi:MAG: transposase, partial [Clostridiales bacterium]|nr:transposase [Clostridiales bacterium]